MGVSVVYTDNTAPTNRDVQGIGSTKVDNSKSLINIDKAFRIGNDMKDTNCIVAVCEKQPNVIVNPKVNEHDTKDIDLDSEKKSVRTQPCQANDMREINISGGTSSKIRKHFKNANGGDTDSEVEGVHTGNAVQRTIDPLCQANDGDGCYLASTDHRKVVSQYFGRNKRCTQLLTDDLWLVWCRKHYQQRRYNLQQEGTWHLKKLELVRIQIERFEKRTKIHCWDITLHKTERILLDRENAAAVLLGARPSASPVWERFLEPYLGRNKTYAQLYVVLRVIEAEFQTAAFVARDNKDKDMPAIEFLPLFPEGTANKPMAKPKNRALIPHVKTKGKPLTSNSASQTTAPESIDKPSPLTHTQTVDTVPVSPSSPCKGNASSPMPLDKDSKKRRHYFSSSQPNASPSTSAPDAVSTSLSSHRKQQVSSLTFLNNFVSEYPIKRRRLVHGSRPKTVHTKTEETGE